MTVNNDFRSFRYTCRFSCSRWTINLRYKWHQKFLHRRGSQWVEREIKLAHTEPCWSCNSEWAGLRIEWSGFSLPLYVERNTSFSLTIPCTCFVSWACYPGRGGGFAIFLFALCYNKLESEKSPRVQLWNERRSFIIFDLKFLLSDRKLLWKHTLRSWSERR